MDSPFRDRAPKPEMLAMRDALVEAIRPFAESVSDPEKLAVLGHLVGSIVALGNYDERITASQLVQLVHINIERGNRDAIQEFTGPGVTRQ